jgi:hypothetical protein
VGDAPDFLARIGVPPEAVTDERVQAAYAGFQRNWIYVAELAEFVGQIDPDFAVNEPGTDDDDNDVNAGDGENAEENAAAADGNEAAAVAEPAPQE